MIKISRKYVVIIITGIMVIGIFAYGGIIKISSIAAGSFDQPEMKGEVDSWQKDEMMNMLTDIRSQKETVLNELADAEDVNEILQYESRLRDLDIQIEVYEIAVEKDIYIYSGGFLAVSLRNIMDSKMQLSVFQQTPEEQMNDAQKAEVNRLKEVIAAYQQIIDDSDYEMYMDLKNDIIDDDISLTEDEKMIKKESNELRLIIDPTGEIASSGFGYDPLESYLSSIETIKRSLLHNIDHTSYTSAKPLTPSGREELTNRLADRKSVV